MPRPTCVGPPSPNALSSSGLHVASHDAPRYTRYPCAMLKGTGAGLVQLGSSNANLRETQNPKINFNPSGDPYDGVSDTDKNDQYAPLMRGLFHVIGPNVHCVLTTNLNVEGVIVIEGTAALGANLEVTVNPTIFSNPPFGYTSVAGNIQPVAGSWRREAAP
jgi:hypothetical protein